MRAIAQDRAKERTCNVLSEFFAGYPLDKVAVRLWDGTAWPNEQPHAAMLALKHPEASGRLPNGAREIGSIRTDHTAAPRNDWYTKIQPAEARNDLFFSGR
ncbi:MAG: hypothetical protein QOE73_1584 [Verrucomicrobiota bacterium]|jgi:hypothetical protein